MIIIIFLFVKKNVNFTSMHHHTNKISLGYTCSDLDRSNKLVYNFKCGSPVRVDVNLLRIVYTSSMNKLFHPKARKITITFKIEPDRKSKSELPGFDFGYKFVLYQPDSNDSPSNGGDRKPRVNIRSGCQVKEWLEFRWDHCERRYKYIRSVITKHFKAFVQIRPTARN